MEAACAGTAGKGFAVVADEVRRLAMQSSDAARVTAQLIKGMMQKADDGVMWQREVLQNLEEIVVQVHDVAAATGEIAAASERQQNGIGQLNLAVEQLNQVTQQTAANAEKTAGIAEELSSQAAEIQHLVETFGLNEKITATPPIPQAHLAR